MKSIAILMLFAWSAVWAQAPSSLTPETVVAHVEGLPVTAAELMTVLQNKPPGSQTDLGDGKALLEELGYVRKLAAMAEKEHLDKQDPWNKMLQLQRTYTMASAELQAAQDAIPVSGEEQKKFYDNNPDRYTQAKVKMLYISFHASAGTDSKGNKTLTEPEAKAKIEKLLAAIRGGADFVKLVKENSDDSASVEKNGDFGTPVLRSDKLPEDIKSAIFALKPGQVSDPIRAQNGFYLFRLEELTPQPYEQVRDSIFIEIRHRRFEEWLAKTKQNIDVKIDNPDFFNKFRASATPSK